MFAYRKICSAPFPEPFALAHSPLARESRVVCPKFNIAQHSKKENACRHFLFYVSVALAVRNIQRGVYHNDLAFFEMLGLSEASAHTRKKYTAGERTGAAVGFLGSGELALPHFRYVRIFIYKAAVGNGYPHFVFTAELGGGAVETGSERARKRNAVEINGDRYRLQSYACGERDQTSVHKRKLTHSGVQSGFCAAGAKNLSDGFVGKARRVYERAFVSDVLEYGEVGEGVSSYDVIISSAYSAHIGDFVVMSAGNVLRGT